MSRLSIGSREGAATRLARSAAGMAAVAVVAALVSACSSGGHSSLPAGEGSAGEASSAKHPASTTTTTVGPHFTISPGDGTAGADPSAGITVTASDATLTNVTVQTAGDPVSGALSQGNTVWHSQGTLDVSQSYKVTATGVRPGGRTVTSVSTFHTLTPTKTFRTEIFEGTNQTYGVGMPIILYFNQHIVDKAAVEQALQVTTSKPVVGAWYWDDPCNMATTCAYFRPRDYWPADTTVSFTGHLDGVQGAPGVYGTYTLSQTFKIGPSLVAVGNTATHRTQIYQDGKLLYNWPISSGRPGDDTPDGSYLTIDKHNPVQMVGPGYNISVPWSVRFTWSGDYYHDAYWSVGQQGFQNVSHGCVNLAPADAQIYYGLAVPGDPITIVGSPVAGTWDNGWTEWFLSWDQYLKGSALHEAVVAGPSGSNFVDPASLPPSAATAPLLTSPANNSAAQ